MTTKTLIEPAEMAQRIVDVMSDRQAEDVVMLDIHEVASFTDYFVIATAQNARHMSAMINAFEKDLANEGIKPLHIEGGNNSGWVLVDFNGVTSPNMLGSGGSKFGECTPPTRAPVVETVLIDYTGDPEIHPSCERYMHRLPPAPEGALLDVAPDLRQLAARRRWLITVVMPSPRMVTP